MKTYLKPIAFRVVNYRSFKDSTWCSLSADGITALIGENEAGKSAVLTALRDFDEDAGEEVDTADMIPDDDSDAVPIVWVRYEAQASDLIAIAADEGISLPEQFLSAVSAANGLAFGRNMITNERRLDPQLVEKLGLHRKDGVGDQGDNSPEAPAALTEEMLVHAFWPRTAKMVYMSSAESHLLPRSIKLSALVAPLESGRPSKVPAPVRDFVRISGIDLKRLQRIAKETKNLRNYLAQRNATISEDFLKFWRQRKKGSGQLRIHVEAQPDGDDLDLTFFVSDGPNQYPDQRSLGFRWFLSFFLRLSADELSGGQDRVYLIDEPGTHLHARAHSDVLHLFQERVARRNTVIYATHAPTLMPPSALHRLRVVVRDHVRGSVVFDRLTHPDLIGPDRRDALTPVMVAIGADVADALGMATKKILLTEGISDSAYIGAFRKALPGVLDESIAIVPCLGAHTIQFFAALLLGIDVRFAVLLDRDKAGDKAAMELFNKLRIEEPTIIRVSDAVTIEDLLSAQDWDATASSAGLAKGRESKESPSAHIRRTNADKVLLAYEFSARVAKGTTLTEQTLKNAKRLLHSVSKALS